MKFTANPAQKEAKVDANLKLEIEQTGGKKSKVYRFKVPLVRKMDMLRIQTSAKKLSAASKGITLDQAFNFELTDLVFPGIKAFDGKDIYEVLDEINATEEQEDELISTVIDIAMGKVVDK